MIQNFYVLGTPQGWDLGVEGGKTPISRHQTCEEAMRIGEAAAKRMHVELIVRRLDSVFGTSGIRLREQLAT